MTDHAGVPQNDEDRDALIWRLRVVNRLTQSAIGERVGLSQERVGQILRRMRERLPAPDIEAIRAEALALHHRTQELALEIAEMSGAPVTAGKDGDVLYDPEHGGVVRDYAGRVAALKLALEADREIRKLLGADAASKTEVSGKVMYEIAGLDVGDLT